MEGWILAIIIISLIAILSIIAVLLYLRFRPIRISRCANCITPTPIVTVQCSNTNPCPNGGICINGFCNAPNPNPTETTPFDLM